MDCGEYFGWCILKANPGQSCFDGVVASSGGYPGDYEKGIPIHGLETVETGPDLQVFHAGTTVGTGEMSTNGGRVLAVCALGEDVEEARRKAYEGMEKIHFQGKYCRTDIPVRS